MTNRVPRRKALLLAGLSVASLAGCLSNPDSHRSLSFTGVGIIEETAESIVIRTRPDMGVYRDWEPIREVSVIGYDSSGGVVCEEEIGDITTLQEDLSLVDLSCQQIPHVVTFNSQNPCGRTISLEARVYEGKQDGEDEWRIVIDRCELEYLGN